MKKFIFHVQTPVGIHARNALMLSRAAADFESDIRIRKGDRTESAKNLMDIMTMRIACGDTIFFTIEGGDEETALKKLEEFCQGNL